MMGCRPVETPVDSNLKLREQLDGNLVDKGSYQCLVGKLTYLSHIGPDIAFAVSVVSYFMHNLQEHMDVVYRILKYLKGTPGKGLFFKRNEVKGIEAFKDANWQDLSMIENQLLGICTFVYRNLVT